MANERTPVSQLLQQAVNYEVRDHVDRIVTGYVHDKIVRDVTWLVQDVMHFNVYTPVRDTIFKARSNRKACNIVETLI